MSRRRGTLHLAALQLSHRVTKNPNAAEILTQRLGNPFDLGRTNVQAALLYRLSADDEYEYALGRTYLASAALVVPRSLWSGRPERKACEPDTSSVQSVPVKFAESR